MNILFFTHVSPFPQNGGERIRSYYLMKVLADLGHRVFAIICNVEKVKLKDYQIEGVEYFIHQVKVGMADRLTGRHHFKANPSVLQIFENICNSTKIDLAFLDYGHLGQYIRYFRDRCIPVILGTHNAQALHTQQIPAKGLVRKLRRSQQVAIEKMHERKYFNQAAAVLVVSEVDKAYHKKFIDSSKLFVIPNFLDEREYETEIVSDPHVLVMTANFSMFMNYEGLKWFVENVWNDEIAAKYQLLLVGRNSKEALRQLKGSDEWNNIKAVGTVADVKPFIGMASGVIIPLLHGSGTRLKCLEAMALRTPVISTAKGVEGVRSDNFIIANTPDSFKQALLNFNGKGLGTLLRQDFMQEYSTTVNRRRIAAIINAQLTPQ
ncbi:glycosyltransferase [Chitinophaga sp. SYP-B3965]|uniref:glycosyltransferase family 4 protein n=1 Tax=Chitinophaga sp. SYP-B3965 TaxID=2663120 RepID=UPI0012998160|nr:glycosyltransferase family 4 protein [Chitinophaga sp. SYP-B3965]MRG43872.1 glycosyltransferase [Chitinophaga sp. SYP-B3965]